jgi:hypothetical protein
LRIKKQTEVTLQIIQLCSFGLILKYNENDWDEKSPNFFMTTTATAIAVTGLANSFVKSSINGFCSAKRRKFDQIQYKI